MKLSLAEQLLLLSYGDESGKPLIAAKNLDYGLAGAKLLDLTYAGQLGSTGGRLHATAAAGGDPVLARIDAKPGHTADWWVYHLADPQRRSGLLAKLVSDGVLEEHTHRWRRSTYPEIDPSSFSGVAEHLREVASGAAAPDERSVALLGLAHACGLDKHHFPSMDRHRLAELTQGDWCGHAVQKIIDAMNVAVLSAVSGGIVASAASAIPAT